MLKEKELEVNNLKELEKVDLTKIYCNPKRLFSKGKNGKINNTLEKSLLKTNLLAATAKNINAVIKANNVYNAGLASAGDQFLLQIATNNNTKLSVQTSFDNNVTYVTTVFFVENNIATVVTQSQNLLGNYDITSFLPKCGVYYIQIRILSGSGNFKFVVPEILKYSNSEPIDNLYQAINLVPSENINATDFFDNSNDFDFYAITSPSDNTTAYINFSFDNLALMKTINAKEPSIENAKIELLGFYVNENKNIDWQINETFLDSLIDHKITFKNKGTYILGVYHTNQTQQGQLEENYSIDVDFERKIITDLVSNGTNFTIQSYKGSYDEGTYDSDYAKTSDFWINGCAVEISGLVKDWIKGQTGKVIARVKNDYNEVILSCFDIGKDGGYKAVIPLPKCQNRDMYAIYHQEKLEWNTLEFIGSNDSDVLDNNDKKVKGLSINGKSKLVIGVYYDPVV